MTRYASAILLEDVEIILEIRERSKGPLRIVTKVNERDLGVRCDAVLVRLAGLMRGDAADHMRAVTICRPLQAIAVGSICDHFSMRQV